MTITQQVKTEPGAEEKLAVDRLFLVTGHPRSGTGYMSRLLQAFGYDVGHERMCKDGTSDWHFAVPPGGVSFRGRPPGSRCWRFCHRIQVVRDPIRTMASVAFTENRHRGSMRFRKLYIDINANDPVESAALSIIRWNQMIAAQRVDLVLRVETAPQDLRSYLGRPLPVVLPPVNVNSRRHAHLSWRQLRQTVSWHVFAAFVNHTLEYGYQAVDNDTSGVAIEEKPSFESSASQEK